MENKIKVERLKQIRHRLNEIWFDGNGPAGGEIRAKDSREFNSLLKEEETLLGEADEQECDKDKQETN